jgi:hypothetical protein
MGVLVTIPEFRIKIREVFSLRNFYILLHQILAQEGWMGKGGDADHRDIETLYSENVYQKGIHRGGKEMWIWWRAEKFRDGKKSGYFKNTLDIDLHVVYLQNVEVIQQGKKMQAQNAEIEIFIRPKVLSDYKGEWDNHWLLKHLKHIYEHRIMHGDIEKQEKDLWREAYYLQSKMKKYLQMRNYASTPSMFFPEKMGHDE